MKPFGGLTDIAGLRVRLKHIVDRVRRDGQGRAIIVVVLVIAGTALSLFGDTVLGKLGLAVLAIAGGLFATWVAGSPRIKR